MADQEKKHWYVLHVYSGKENYVVDFLKRKVEERGMSEMIEEAIVPTEKVEEMRAGQKRKTERKFFPGYVLIRMAMNDDIWHFINDTPYVLGFAGKGSSRISDREAETILNRLKEGAEVARPKVLYEPGEVIRVIDGPFADFNGVVEEVNYEKSRVKVSILIFGRSTPVELAFGQVAKG